MSNGLGLVGIGARRRVERLLLGDARKDDLHELFFSMRDKTGGSGFVGEIGNFIAHPNVRTQGIIWRELCDQFAFLKFRIPLAHSTIITTDVPASLPDAMRANLRRMRKNILQRETGKNRVQAGKILERIFSRMTPTAQGGLSKMRIKNQEEMDVTVCVCSHSKGGSLFTDDDLFEDFCRALQKQSLLRPQEKGDLKKVKPFISLFALSAMHNRKVELYDGSVAWLTIISDIKKRLAIFGFSEVTKDQGTGPLMAGGWVFETGLPISQYCEQDVAPLGRYPFIGEMTISADGKLQRVI